MIGLAFVIVLVMVILGVTYEMTIAPRRWMKKHSEGLYNPWVKFNKKHLNIRKG